MASKPQTVAFIGLGNLGIYMSANLAKHLEVTQQPPLLVWNRTKPKISEVDSKHITPCDSLASIAAEADVIITSLANDNVVNSVYAELLPHVKEGALLIETSTVDPDVHVELEKRAAERKASVVGAPVFGPPPLAKSAQLVLVLAGKEAAQKRTEELLVPSVCKKAIRLGEDVSQAAKLKLIGNSMVVSVIELVSEALTFGDKTGVGADNVRQFIDLFLNTPSFVGYSQKIADNKFTPAGFPISGGLKDLGHIRKLAASVDCPLPIVDIAQQHMVTARSLGNPDLDWSSLAAGQRLSAGLEPFHQSSSLKLAYEASQKS